MQRDIKKTIKIINDISPSFCAAKWLNATIWLGNGRTASCHLPPAHSIPLDGLTDNPSLIHNTEYKKLRRQEMLHGIRSKECAYCWTVEDNRDTDVHSDRAYKSYIYTEEEIKNLKHIGVSDVDPKTLEISFDNLCNLSCSYCNSEFSSTWASDIKENGKYPEMKTPGGMTYYNDGQMAMPYGSKNENNPYVEAFFKWFHASLKYNLTELRVTGGEPCRSPSFWRLLDECKNTEFDFAVNSNLIMDKERLDKLIESSKKFKKFDLYTSCEAYGEHAEFVRAGLDYKLWKENLLEFSQKSTHSSIHIMLTVSALSIWTITEFMNDILSMREQLGKPQFYMSINILRYPSFQNVNVLPVEMKLELSKKISTWLEKAKYLTEFEKNQINRLETYLRTVDRSYEDTDSLENKQHDLKVFFLEYAKRTNKNYMTIFSKQFCNWIESI
jgi:organic radical activating enzyme